MPPGRERDQRLTRLDMVIQNKGAMAVAVLTLVLMAVPLGIKVSRRETSANLGIAVIMAIAYYFSTVVVSWFDRYPEFRPDLLVWAPNLVFLVIGLWLNLRVERA
jgi:lipopolysaccharide export system permease protein